MIDHYETLGVPRDAKFEDIVTAWKRAASLHHPDRGGDPEKFRAARMAFEVLTDPTARERHDAALAGNDGAAGLVTQDDYNALAALPRQPRSGPCVICGGSREVRVVQSGFWLRKRCPAC